MPAQMKLTASYRDAGIEHSVTVPTPYPDQFDPAGCRFTEDDAHRLGWVADRAYAKHLEEIDREAADA